MSERRLVVLVTPAEDLPGQWVAHCLGIDLVTQGNSLDHALHMAKEAILMALQDDLDKGLNSYDRERAPLRQLFEAKRTIGRGTREVWIDDVTTISSVVAILDVDQGGTQVTGSFQFALHVCRERKVGPV